MEISPACGWLIWLQFEVNRGSPFFGVKWPDVRRRHVQVSRAWAFLRTSFWIFSSSNTRCSLGSRLFQRYPTCLYLLRFTDVNWVCPSCDPMVPQNKLRLAIDFPMELGHFGPPKNSQIEEQDQWPAAESPWRLHTTASEVNNRPRNVGQKWGTNDEASNQSLDYCERLFWYILYWPKCRIIHWLYTVSIAALYTLLTLYQLSFWSSK